MNNLKTSIAVGVTCLLGFSAQFINRTITRLRTGKKDFVGYSDVYRNTSNKKEENTDKTTAFKGFESDNFFPTRPQLKNTIYPVGIIGKLFASRCGDEARETSIKSVFTFLNFLIIPNLIKNIVAYGFGNKNIFNNLTIDENKGFFSKIWKIKDNTIKSYDEIRIFSERMGKQLGNLDNNRLIQKLGGLISKPEKLIGSLGRNNGDRAKIIAEYIAKELNGIKNTSKIFDILYSVFNIGYRVNLLNIYITNNKRKKYLESLNKLNNININTILGDHKFKQVYSIFINKN